MPASRQSQRAKYSLFANAEYFTATAPTWTQQVLQKRLQYVDSHAQRQQCLDAAPGVQRAGFWSHLDGKRLGRPNPRICSLPAPSEYYLSSLKTLPQMKRPKNHPMITCRRRQGTRPLQWKMPHQHISASPQKCPELPWVKHGQMETFCCREILVSGQVFQFYPRGNSATSVLA